MSYRTLAEVIKTISSVDSSLGQIPQNHLAFIEHLRLDASEEQQHFFFDLILRGARLGNAFSEKMPEPLPIYRPPYAKQPLVMN